MRDLPAPAVWLVATTGNVVAAAFNSQIGAAPIAIAWMRMVVASAGLALIARATHRAGSSRALLVMGPAIAGMNASFYEALPRIGIGLTVSLALTGPIVLAAAYGRTRGDAFAVALAAVGVLAMARPWQGRGDLVGVAIGLAGGVCWVVCIVAGRRAAPGMAPAQAAIAGLAVAAAVLTVPG